MSDTQAATQQVEAFKDDPVSAGPGAEPTPAPVAAEPVEAFKDDPISPDATVGSAAALPIEEKVNKDEVKVTAEPITKGILGYKAPGLVSQLRFSKKYFWLGDEAIPAKDLGAYLRGEKPEVSHPNAAWSSQTGKGLLYFAKRSEDTKAPAGLINLADVSEVAKEGTNEFSFKLYNHKHTFQAKDTKERDGWLVAVETEAKNATEAREGITTSEAYKETLAHLKKPLPAAAAAAGSTAPISSERKKSTDGADATNDKKDTQKSRSASRGKRGSVFGGLLGKKEEQDKEAKKDEPATESAEKKDEAEADKPEAGSAVPTAAAAGTVGAVGAAAVVSSSDNKEEAAESPATESKSESPKGTSATSKSNKRGSIFGGLFQKSDKKEETPAAKEEETPKTTEPATETTETPATTTADTTEPTTIDTAAAAETKPTETSSATPQAEKDKRRSSFFGFGSTKKDKKSEPNNTTDSEPPATTSEEPPATTATEPPATTAAEPVITTTPEKEKAKTEKTEKSEKRQSKLGEIFRRPSQALKGKKEKKETAQPATVAESGEPTAAAVTEEKPNMNGSAASNPLVSDAAATETKSSEPKTLGDVVPEAVTVGEAPQANQTIQATA